MKKLLNILLIVLCLIAALAGCAGKSAVDGGNSAVNEAGSSAAASGEEILAPESGEQGFRIETVYYTVTLPEPWRETCIYSVTDGDNGSCSLSFYDKASYEESGGWLFSIVLLPAQDDYTYYPAYEVLGSIETQDAGAFNAIVSYPTDVQFSEETAAEYCGMYEEIPEVLKTVSFRENCTFSETPTKAEGTAQQP